MSSSCVRVAPGRGWCPITAAIPLKERRDREVAPLRSDQFFDRLISPTSNVRIRRPGRARWRPRSAHAAPSRRMSALPLGGAGCLARQRTQAGIATGTPPAARDHRSPPWRRSWSTCGSGGMSEGHAALAARWRAPSWTGSAHPTSIGRTRRGREDGAAAQNGAARVSRSQPRDHRDRGLTTNRPASNSAAEAPGGRCVRVAGFEPQPCRERRDQRVPQTRQIAKVRQWIKAMALAG